MNTTTKYSRLVLCLLLTAVMVFAATPTPAASPLSLPAAIAAVPVLVQNLNGLQEQAFEANEATAAVVNGALSQYWSNPDSPARPAFPSKMTWKKLDVNTAIIAFYAVQQQFSIPGNAITVKIEDAIASNTVTLDPKTVSVGVNADNTPSFTLQVATMPPALPNIINPVGTPMGFDSVGHEWFADASTCIYATAFSVPNGGATTIGGSIYRFHHYATPFNPNVCVWEMTGSAPSMPTLTPIS